MAPMDQRGVTILELLLALFLLAVSLIGLASAFPYAMYGVTAGGYQTQATLLAEQMIDLAKGTEYASLSTLATGGTCSSGGTYTAVTGFTGFTRCVQVDVTDDAVSTPPKHYTTVTAVVRFSGVIPTPIYDTTVATVIAQPS